jgi:hypothetical protein
MVDDGRMMGASDRTRDVVALCLPPHPPCCALSQKSKFCKTEKAHVRISEPTNTTAINSLRKVCSHLSERGERVVRFC